MSPTGSKEINQINAIKCPTGQIAPIENIRKLSGLSNAERRRPGAMGRAGRADDNRHFAILDKFLEHNHWARRYLADAATVPSVLDRDYPLEGCLDRGSLRVLYWNVTSGKSLWTINVAHQVPEERGELIKISHIAESSPSLSVIRIQELTLRGSNVSGCSTSKENVAGEVAAPTDDKQKSNAQKDYPIVERTSRHVPEVSS